MSVASSAGTGAAAGAAAGSVVPGIGTAIGTIGGALVGGIGGLLSESATRKAKRNAINSAINTLQSTSGYSDSMMTQGSQVLADQLAAAQGIYGNTADVASALQAARDKVNALSPYEAGTFQYDKDISDFYDPAFQLSVNSANDALNSSQALGGNLFSSGTADKLAAQNQVLASNMYKEALSAFNTDKSLEQSIWSGNEAAKQAAANSAANLANSQYSMASDAAGNLSSANNSFYQGLLDLNNDYWNNKSDYWAQIANLQAQKY
jgi:hypothetical protein